MRVYGVVGWKNAGKTGLMERLITEITGRGFSVSTVKHAHHTFDVDHPGKDSTRHRQAGATEVMLSSRNRWALMHENRGQEESPLADLLAKTEPVDLVLIEGYKRDTHPKVEAHRAETRNPLIAREDSTIRAVASDTPLSDMTIPVFDLNDTTAVADFILEQVGLVDKSAQKPNLVPPRLKDDCFALPAGVDWVPVDQALDTLKAQLTCTVGVEEVASAAATGRILAQDVVARRSNPPGANSAVDGYGFAHAAIGAGAQVLPTVAGRAAAGKSYTGTVPPGQAIRILTGALLPKGVDTVVLQEDVTVGEDHIAFDASLKARSNTRKAGEDVGQDDLILTAGRRLRPQDIALMSAVGVTQVSVHTRLRVGVLSTGDEIAEPGSTQSIDQTYDANRPMLLSVLAAWGY